MGYLDDLSKDLTAPDSNPIPEEESREANVMSKDNIDRAGPGSWDSYVEFSEFDGGDGQMGVAGDGSTGLDKFDMSQMAKSKSMSAKNAWGTNTGYADKLVAEGVDTSRAQQLENWHNQQEVLARRKEQRSMTEDFESTSTEEENWRNLASFGVERNQVNIVNVLMGECECSYYHTTVFCIFIRQIRVYHYLYLFEFYRTEYFEFLFQEFDLDETFGAVAVNENIEGTIELLGQMNAGYAVHEMKLKVNNKLKKISRRIWY